ncbi:hypothetical protein FGO68_gene16129 [Halteria grandinella]|uniref:Uncharacterized protein n=1 Tax=Halteria grandinella TaxID=5974 RepID=A0A8J8NJU3_HALGN|nr:hypothetical protein FGO68_gene16129 [Halteria grandinella]
MNRCHLPILQLQRSLFLTSHDLPADVVLLLLVVLPLLLLAQVALVVHVPDLLLLALQVLLLHAALLLGELPGREGDHCVLVVQLLLCVHNNVFKQIQYYNITQAPSTPGLPGLNISS